MSELKTVKYHWLSANAFMSMKCLVRPAEKCLKNEGSGLPAEMVGERGGSCLAAGAAPTPQIMPPCRNSVDGPHLKCGRPSRPVWVRPPAGTLTQDVLWHGDFYISTVANTER